jgi:formylglycine-generating enzyme required for sulfatase activity
MGSIFISYRREDSPADSGRIYDRLWPKYGRENVFKDVDTIPLGADFRQILTGAVAKCDVMLVVIGKQWVSILDASGQRRLDHPSDFVRIEIEEALTREIPVIPVLVQNAPMPQEGDLPLSLAKLAYRNGMPVRSSDPFFHGDMDLLIHKLDAMFAQAASAPAEPAPHVTPAHVTSSPAAPGEPQSISLPAHQFPPRLGQLGLVAYRSLRGAEYILPPVCTVPEGAFLMGSDPDLDPQATTAERPQHRVTLPAFQIGAFPVTVAEYACFVRVGQKEPSNWQQQIRSLDHPVVNVAWRDTVAYATWLAAHTGQPWRLPSEAEWEMAARGNEGLLYPWGDAFDASRCNTVESKKGGTTPAGGYPSGASSCGAQDLAGNVWEWTRSVYKPYPYTAGDGRERMESTEARVLRGGCWRAPAREARAAFRLAVAPFFDILHPMGFRLVRASPSS